MTLRKLNSAQKIFLSLMLNILLFGGVFSLKFFGITTNTVLLLLALVVSLEVIYLSFFIQMSVNRNSQNIWEAEKHIESIKIDEERIYTALIYTGHQLKALQHELNTIKKGHTLKSSGHSNLRKMHA